MGKKEKLFNTYRKTGVFKETVRGVTVGYFVGWRFRWDGGARNIRRGLYFDSAKQAELFRDSLETELKVSSKRQTQIA